MDSSFEINSARINSRKIELGKETAMIERLHKFIADSDYEIAGIHEEEHFTRPEAKVQKTIIQHPIKQK